MTGSDRRSYQAQMETLEELRVLLEQADGKLEDLMKSPVGLHPTAWERDFDDMRTELKVIITGVEDLAAVATHEMGES